MAAEAQTKDPATLTEALLGKEFLNGALAKRLAGWPAEYRATLTATLLAMLVFVPYLGAVGLWDPWETHYGEVAREMIQRNDYVHPWWESAWFFSKPAFTMWMQAFGMQLAGVGPLAALLLGGALCGLGVWLFMVVGTEKKSAAHEFWGAILGCVGALAIALSAWGFAIEGNLSRQAYLGILVTLVTVGFVLRLGLRAYEGVDSERRSPTYRFWFAVRVAVAVLGLGLGAWRFSSHVPWKFAGVTSGDGALPLFLEWGFRLPFTGFSIVAVALLTYALTRTVNARVALATAVVLVTMPLYFLLSRQAVTDPPIVSATISGIACALVAMLDAESKRKTEWWYAAYVFFAIATLAKGWLGFLVPAAVFGGYVALFVFTFARLGDQLKWLWRVMGSPVLTGLAAGLLVGAIAYKIGEVRGTMFMSGPPKGEGLPGAGKDILSAAHWLGITWGLLAAWAAATVAAWPALKKETVRPPALFDLLVNMRLGTGILLFLAVSLPWYYEMFTFWRVDDESKLFWFRFVVHDHLSRFFSGVHTTTPGGSFTYFIEQGGFAIFPWVLLVPGAVAVVSRFRVRGGGTADAVGVIAVLWLLVSWFAVGGSATKFHHYVFPMLPPMAILIGLFIDKLWDEGIDAHLVALLIGVPLFILVGKDLWTTPKNFTDLFVYNYDRPYPEFLTTRPVVGSNSIKDMMRLGILFFLGLSGIFAFLRAKSAMFTSGLAGAMCFALWFNWSHWVDLSHHWTQRDQFWRYYTQRQAGEPIAAFLMNWRGETFYSRNTVKQIKDNANVAMAAYAQQPGRKWSLVEHARLGVLKGAVGTKQVTIIDKDLNNKFVLVTIGE